jgi:hypothetical protein
MKHKNIIIKPYTHQELADLYGMSWRTMDRWLKPLQHLLGEKNGHYYTTRQVRIIFTELGWPPSDEEGENKTAA